MTILTNALRREIASLAQPKGRRKSQAFMAEGTKCVIDTLGAFKLRHLLATAQWLADHQDLDIQPQCIVEVKRQDLVEMTSMTLAPDVIAVYDLPEPPVFNPSEADNALTVALDRVQDPGNLGTIMRTADWMGVTTILTSADTVDCFNPKTVQATMGAISRVRVVYGNLPEMLRAVAARGVAVCGTFLGGENVYQAPLPRAAVVVMGNEGAGISESVAAAVSRRLLIPSWPPERPTSESLNVATATAIILSQFRSRLF